MDQPAQTHAGYFVLVYQDPFWIRVSCILHKADKKNAVWLPQFTKGPLKSSTRGPLVIYSGKYINNIKKLNR